MSKESLLIILQREWNMHNSKYSEDGFKEYVSEYVDAHDEEGFYINDDGETVATVDWVLHNLDLRR